MKMNKKYSGFTLVELLIVIAIIGILSMIAIPRFASVTAGATIGTMRANHRTLLSGTFLWSGNHGGKVPTTADTDAWKFIMDFAGVKNDKPSGTAYALDDAGVVTSVYTHSNLGKFTITTTLADNSDMIETADEDLKQFIMTAE